jgi:hypothetical protein
MEPDRGQYQFAFGLCLWIDQDHIMSGYSVFEQIVVLSDQAGRIVDPITADDYEQWRHDYIWEALHGIRYGQSFCNHFGVTDNHLYYAPGDIAWCDNYIRKTYLA